MKKQLLALTAALTTVSALSSTPSAQALHNNMSDEEQYISLLEVSAEGWSGIPNWGFRAQRSKWIERGREVCRKADNGTSILAQFREAKRKGDRKQMMAIWGASNPFCYERHSSIAIQKKLGNYLGSL